MENDCAIDQSEFEKFGLEFSDEALEKAVSQAQGRSSITLSYCTGLNFCPGP